ncbi:MAG: hypothetical protein ACLUPV_01650 [Bilophila wadsworthia]
MRTPTVTVSEPAVKHVDKGFDLAGRAVGHGGPAAGQGRADVLI